jgi:hypothetical protein
MPFTGPIRTVHLKTVPVAPVFIYMISIGRDTPVRHNVYTEKGSATGIAPL